jgi:hypothetical protein
MKSINRLTVFLVLLFSLNIAYAQEKNNAINQASTVKSEENAPQKAQNNNTVKSNRTESKAVVEQSNSGSTQTNNGGTAGAKKGYDYYQAKSDLNTTKTATSSSPNTKAQDHNSSRSNKTVSSVDQGNGSGTSEKRVNKVEAISVKQQ